VMSSPSLSGHSVQVHDLNHTLGHHFGSDADTRSYDEEILTGTIEHPQTTTEQATLENPRIFIIDYCRVRS